MKPAFSIPATGEACPMKREVTIQLSKGLSTVIDEEDFERVSKYNWILSRRRQPGKYYVRRNFRISFKVYGHEMLHRFLLNAPDDMCVDHINGDGMDNRKSNLRLCTFAQNKANTAKNPGLSSKYKGVTRCGNMWRATIMVNFKNINLGYFASEEDAGRAYDSVAVKTYGEFARPNFPNELSVSH